MTLIEIAHQAQIFRISWLLMNINLIMKRKQATQPHFNGSLTFNQAGISLIEILVTVLILAIGSLGIASLQIAGLKYSSGSYARTQAIILSDDMASRLKANRNSALNPTFGGGFGVSPYELNTFEFTRAVQRDCITTACDEDELAEYDLASWVNEVSRVLPSGSGRIRVFDSQNPDGIRERQFSIELQWRQVANSSSQQADEDLEVKSVAFRVSI